MDKQSKRMLPALNCLYLVLIIPAFRAGEASWLNGSLQRLASTPRKLLQLIPNVSCTNATGFNSCQISGGVTVGDYGAGYVGQVLQILPSSFSNGGGFASGEVYGTYVDPKGQKTTADTIVYPVASLNVPGNQKVATYLVNNLSTVTSAGKDVGNVQNLLIPVYVQSNASDYVPGIGDSWPGNVGVLDNTVVSSLNQTASVRSGASIPGGAYFNQPVVIPAQLRPDSP
eukprot:jgi/Botrbrau1/22677/Bobra.0132s0021.1